MDDESLAQLERAVLEDPAEPGFAALAELHRRAGRLAEAEAVARAGLALAPDAWEGRVALALTLLERGQDGEAREGLASIVDDCAEALGIPLRVPVAQEAEAPSGGLAPDAVQSDAPVDAEPVGLGHAFATETMAGLLESQGDRAGAERIRANLDLQEFVPGAVESGPAHVVHQLERWLANAQRLVAERA